MKLKCPICQKAGLKSKVYKGSTLSTLISIEEYYDEGGALHHHDSNWHTTEYRCSNGHEFCDKWTRKCPSCDFGGEFRLDGGG